MIPEQETYQQQLARQLTDARNALSIAEDELAKWRRRAFDEAALKQRSETAEARLAAVTAECEGAVEGWRNESAICSARIAAVRTLHRPAPCGNADCSGQWCIGCDPEGLDSCDDHPWPCPTIRALDGDTPADVEIRLAKAEVPPVEPAPNHQGQDARSMLLNLLAQWGMKSGNGSRSVVDELLRRHAVEVAASFARQVDRALPQVGAAFVCEHRDPKKLGHRPGSGLALFCQCGEQVSPGLRQESARDGEAGFRVVTTGPVEEVAAEPVTLGRLKTQFFSGPADRGGFAAGQVGEFFGFPLVPDGSLPAGEVHLRPAVAQQGQPDDGTGYAGESDRLPDGSCPEWCRCHGMVP
ncbi:hypothetical protein ACWGB8_01685 [Kitasatospora sp. NPDC054939]